MKMQMYLFIYSYILDMFVEWKFEKLAIHIHFVQIKTDMSNARAEVSEELSHVQCNVLKYLNISFNLNCLNQFI